MSDDQTTEETRTGGPTLTHSQSVKRLEEIKTRMEELGELDELNASEEQEFTSLRSEWDQVNKHRKQLELRAELAAVRTDAEQVTSSRRLRLERGSNSQGSRGDYDKDSILEPDSIEDCRFRNPWDLSEVRTYGRDAGEVAGEMRARALSAIEKMQGCSDNIRQAATKILERFDSADGKLARQCLITSSPAYLRAWSKTAVNRQHTMTPAEQRAMAEAEAFRAMSLTDSAGGYLVPFQLDPTVINTSDGSANDIRMFARQVVATGDVWNGVSSANVSWSWDAEASEVSDDAPTFAQPSIPIYKAAGFVPISIEAMQDEANVAQEVGKLLAGGKDDLEAVALITGSGSGQPTGIVTALAASSPTVIVSAAADDTFALKDVYALQGALPGRYRGRASWLANNLIYNLIRQFDTAGGAGLWSTLGQDRSPVLLGKPVGEAEAMDGTITTSGAVANYAAIFGDFSNYVIADRIGMTVEFIPHLFHTSNNRPSGQRGWYAYARMGADSVNDKGFRMLNVASAS
ncbi:phage major capsid protein [Mycobacterium paragordonae]|uniref:phage major capsid protein n=1 Tax=Mycobacterium paragordonae TaxID=1389713 RepID=UPI001F0F5C22|nr:phage major capsid protein [Mycobacterium paragordonae]